MRRNRKFKRSAVTEVNILPLIDVLFLLLAFFIILTTSMVLQKGFPVNLAQAESGSKTEQDPEQLAVSLSKAGDLYLGKDKVTLVELGERLSAEKTRVPDAVILLSADKDATHQTVTSIMDAVRKGGFFKIIMNVSPSRGNA